MSNSASIIMPGSLSLLNISRTRAANSGVHQKMQSSRASVLFIFTSLLWIFSVHITKAQEQSNLADNTIAIDLVGELMDGRTFVQFDTGDVDRISFGFVYANADFVNAQALLTDFDKQVDTTAGGYQYSGDYWQDGTLYLVFDRPSDSADSVSNQMVFFQLPEDFVLSSTLTQNAESSIEISVPQSHTSAVGTMNIDSASWNQAYMAEVVLEDEMDINVELTLNNLPDSFTLSNVLPVRSVDGAQVNMPARNSYLSWYDSETNQVTWDVNPVRTASTLVQYTNAGLYGIGFRLIGHVIDSQGNQVSIEFVKTRSFKFLPSQTLDTSPPTGIDYGDEEEPDNGGGNDDGESPEVTLNSSADTVSQFGAFTLSWTSEHADSCMASGDWTGSKATTGTETLSSTTAGTKTYSLTCEGAGGSSTQSVSVVISAASPQVTLTSSADTVSQFDPFTLDWTSEHTDSCTASGDWTGSKATTGTETLSSATTGSKTYSLTCEGAGGSATQSLSITVIPPSPTVTLTSSADTVSQFDPFTLSWTSEHADSCMASGDWSGDKTTAGTETLSSATTGAKTYSLTCEGAGGSKTSSVSVEMVQAPIAENVVLEGIYLAQTHVAQPNNAYFNLTSNRAALLKVDLSSSNAGISPTVTAIVSNNGETESLTLQGPGKLPLSEEVTAELGKVQHKMENSFTAVVPKEFVQPNMTLTLKVSGETIYERNIEVGAPNAMSLNMFDVHYFNEVENQSDYPPNTFNELLSKWPVSDLSLQRVRNIIFEQLVIPARGGAPAVRVSSPDEYRTKTGLNFDGEQAAALQWVHALSAAGGNQDIAMMYINIIGVHAGGQAGAFDGVGQGGDHGILHHELGHAFGLPHWQGNAAYPYRGYAYGIPGDTISWETNEMKVNVGPVWGFDLPSMTFLPPIIDPSGGHSSRARYKWDPMQGGGTGTQTYPFLLNHFSDYSVKKMQLYIEDKLAVARDGGFYHWNDVDKSYSRPIEAPIGVRYPINLDQQIFSVMAATALADRDINMIYPPIGPYTGNLIHTFDPNVPSDRELANTLNYCPSDGCDFSLRVQQGDVVNWFMLSSSASEGDDPYERASLSTVAVNLSASNGDISDITLYHTPNANLNGIDNPEQLADWNDLAAVDQCPANPNKNTAGVCGCELTETDSDFDGIPDCVDLCPFDPIKKAPRECGCGQLEGTCAPQYRFEAEEAALSHDIGVIADLKRDYRGTGYVDYRNVGSWIKWDNVYAPSEGQYEVIFRYAAASSRPTNVLVNDSLEATIGTVAGNGWNDWIEQPVSLELKQGINVIRVVAEDSTGVNLDYMSAPGLTKSEPIANGHDDRPITCTSENTDKKLKVFILAGQSNMIGVGRVEHYVTSNNSTSGKTQYPSNKQHDKSIHSFGKHIHWLSGVHACEMDTLVSQNVDFYETGKGKLRYLVNEVNGRFDKLVDNQGNWRVRDDVWIESRGSKPYSGWMSPTISNDNKFGPDFMFGNAIGDALNDDVLIIKVAWGGKSLQTDFRPPSSGGQVGQSYTEMIEHIHAILADIENLVPNYSIDDGYEISGFGWHQGWNDGGSWDAVNEYAFNLTNLINDIRAELNSPDLPFVIASSGFRGFNGEVDRREALMAIQEEVTQYPEFADNTGFVDTRPFWRDRYESPGDQVHHWNLNAETYYLIGKEMGRSMVELSCRP